MKRPTMPPAAVFAAWLGAVAVSAGCALTGKSDAITPRYFTPERVTDGARPGARPEGVHPELRLGRIRGASHLDERLVFRDSDYELGYYEERRWTEAPEQYVRRRLARVLFEERGAQQVVGGAASVLDVELTAFEEIRAPVHLARVRLTARLHDQRLVRWEETLTVDQPVAAAKSGDDAAAVVAALGEGLRKVVDRVAERVMVELQASPRATGQPATAAPRPDSDRDGPGKPPLDPAP